MNIALLFTIIILVILAALAAFWAGFRFRPKVIVPSHPSFGDVPTVPPPTDLPPLLLRALEANFSKQLPISSPVVAWGRGRIVAGRMPILGPLWTPLVWTLNLSPTEGFVLETRLSWFGRVFVVGTEELRHGHGRFDLGVRVIENANLDLSETTLFWIYSAWLSPFSLLTDSNTTWETVDDRTIRGSLPFADGSNRTFDLVFDPQNNHLQGIDTSRTTSKEGTSLPFHVVFSQHRSFDNSFVFPARLILHWDEEAAYMQLDLAGVRYNVQPADLMKAGSP